MSSGKQGRRKREAGTKERRKRGRLRGCAVVTTTQPLLFHPRPPPDQPSPLRPTSRHFEFGSVQSSCNPPSLPPWKAAHKARRQLPLIVSSPEISQTFLRLNGLKRHTPAHLRAPVRVLSLSFLSLRLFQVRFPFRKGIIKSNAIPRRVCQGSRKKWFRRS